MREEKLKIFDIYLQEFFIIVLIFNIISGILIMIFINWFEGLVWWMLSAILIKLELLKKEK